MFKNYSKLLRVGQWYKNLIIFLPVLLFDGDFSLTRFAIAFYGFCAVSSLTYIINDWIDREKDKLHPLKKMRPLASGKISGRAALITALILTALVVHAAFVLQGIFAWAVIAYFILTNLYSLILKRIPIIEMLFISLNFIIRMIAGVPTLPPLESFGFMIVIFAFILVFLTHKRRSEIKVLGVDAAQHKAVLKHYTTRVLYNVRIGGFALVLGASVFLHLKSQASLSLVLLNFIFLSYSSYLFSRNPDLVIKHKGLFKYPTWVLALISFIISLVANTRSYFLFSNLL